MNDSGYAYDIARSLVAAGETALLAHDHELFQRFALGGARFVHVPKALMAVRDHAGREVDIHSPSNWSRLIGESKRLVLAARASLDDPER